MSNVLNDLSVIPLFPHRKKVWPWPFKWTTLISFCRCKDVLSLVVTDPVVLEKMKMCERMSTTTLMTDIRQISFRKAFSSGELIKWKKNPLFYVCCWPNNNLHNTRDFCWSFLNIFGSTGRNHQEGMLIIGVWHAHISSASCWDTL